MKTYEPSTIRLKQVDSFIRELFENKLPKNLYYHNAGHTLHPLEGVVSMAEFLGELEGISPKSRELLATAAYFHDAGYIERYPNNEEIGARIAGEVLPGLSYTPEEITIVNNLILATKIPTHPKTHLEQILCDADVDNLGRDDFIEKNELLRKELNLADKAAYYGSTIRFLEKQQYYTKSAQMLRNAKKAENLEKIRETLAKEITPS